MNHWLCLVCNTLNKDYIKRCTNCKGLHHGLFFNEYLRLNHYIDMYITDTITVDDMNICDYETQNKLGMYLIEVHIKSRIYWKRIYAWENWRKKINKKLHVRYLHTIKKLYPVYSVIESFL